MNQPTESEFLDDVGLKKPDMSAARAAVKHKTEGHLSTKKLQSSDISDYDQPSSSELEAQPPNTIDFVRAENDAIAQTLF